MQRFRMLFFSLTATNFTFIKWLSFFHLIYSFLDADSFMPCCRVCKPPWSDGSRSELIVIIYIYFYTFLLSENGLYYILVILGFWEETSNLLDAAERFAMSKSIKKYVARMISKDACNCGCWECFDGFIFSSAYNLDVVSAFCSVVLFSL